MITSCVHALHSVPHYSELRFPEQDGTSDGHLPYKYRLLMPMLSRMILDFRPFAFEVRPSASRTRRPRSFAGFAARHVSRITRTVCMQWCFVCLFVQIWRCRRYCYEETQLWQNVTPPSVKSLANLSSSETLVLPGQPVPKLDRRDPKASYSTTACIDVRIWLYQSYVFHALFICILACFLSFCLS